MSRFKSGMAKRDETIIGLRSENFKLRIKQQPDALTLMTATLPAAIGSQKRIHRSSYVTLFNTVMKKRKVGETAADVPNTAKMCNLEMSGDVGRSKMLNVE